MAEFTTHFQLRKDDGGIIRVEQWPEGFVLWFDGQIVWKEWQKKSDKQTVTLELKLDTTALQATISEIANKIGNENDTKL